VRSQQCPASWASAGDLRAFDQLAQQQIALAVVTDGHDPHGVLASFTGSGGQPLLVGDAATVWGSMPVALWPMIAGYLAAGRTRR
jgi:hypothetical protein